MNRLLILSLTCLCLPAFAGSKQKQNDKTDQLFGDLVVPRIQIEIPSTGIGKLEKYQWQFGQQGERESVNATVREGNHVYTNVALHLKGAAGSFRPITDNPAMTLNFDKNVKGQHFHGLSKISLNNSVQDPSLISEEFCRELFLKAGVATPRATHAVVELNGRDLGVYVLVEGFNKSFLRRHFKNAEGHLYDGGFTKDVDSELALNSGENPKDQSDRIALKDAALEPDLQKRQERLEKVLDLDQFLTYIALDVMLWDWDGYAQNKNNWRLYHDPATGKMFFIPHGLDQMFWKPEGSILPPMQGMVAKAALQIPAVRDRYFQKMRELRSTVYQPGPMTNRVRAIAAKISPILKAKYPDRAAEEEKAVDDFCSAIVQRARSIDDQLATPISPVKFDENGIAQLANWQSKTNFGHPMLVKKSGENGATLLEVGTGAGSSIGSWRTKVWLEPGKYRVETRLKTENIVPDIGDPRGGAGIRLARENPDSYLPGTTDWKKITHDFSLDDLSEVQIFCEFRGASGDAVFDTVQLIREAEKKK